MTQTMSLPRLPAPRVARVRQCLPNEHVADVRRETQRRLLAFRPKDRVKPGYRIAIMAGSRGIGGSAALLNGVADAVRQAGGEPFLVPAIGSHGGATPEGQTEILHRLGVTEYTISAPIRATMETVVLGTAENGADVRLDKNAAEADGIIVLGHAQNHPESIGSLASGLLKMITIGLGKQSEAFQAQSHGLWDSVMAVPRVLLAKANVRCGVAVVENGYRQPIVVEVIPPEFGAFFEGAVRRIRTEKAHLARLPFVSLDVLAIDEVGLFSAPGGDSPRLCRIRNTDKIDEFWVSEAMLPQAREEPKLTEFPDPEPMAFGAGGNLF